MQSDSRMIRLRIPQRIKDIRSGLKRKPQNDTQGCKAVENRRAIMKYTHAKCVNLLYTVLWMPTLFSMTFSADGYRCREYAIQKINLIGRYS